MRVRVDVDIRGPIWTGLADRAWEAFKDEAPKAIASEAHDNVMANLHSSIRVRTPYYETQITTERRGAEYWVHDRGVIYGHWLEGTGSRNAPVTIFPGYWSFKRAAAKTRVKARTIANRLLRSKYLPIMRGR